MTGTVLITASDAGGANYLAPVIERLRVPFRVCAQAPAADILAARGIVCEVFEREHDWADLAALGTRVLGHGTYRAVVCGTSWGPTLDKAVTLAARAANLPTCAVVDHWDLYRERFSRVTDGAITEADVFLPDWVCVNDRLAQHEAIRAGLPRGRVRVMGQPHLEAQRTHLLPLRHARRNHDVVFVSERIGEDFVAGSPLDRGFDEFTALDMVVAALRGTEARLIIKLHPQDPPDKYAAYVERGDVAKVIGACDIGQLIATSGRIVGMVSMLLLEAALLRGDVISVTPGVAPTMFVGTRLGAVRGAATVEQLKALLLTEEMDHASAFGERFVGSTARMVEFIEEFMA